MQGAFTNHRASNRPLACANCNDLLSTAKAVCPTWTEATDTVRGLTATKWTATNCKPAHIAHPYPINLTTHVSLRRYKRSDSARGCNE